MSARRGRPRALILGAGFAGLACANALSARDFAVTVVDRKRHFEFLPNIHEIISGVKRPAQLRIPLAATLKAQGHRFIRDQVLAIDATERRLQLASGREIRGDYLVLAPGSEDGVYGIPGVREHALPLRSVDQARAIHTRLEALAKEPGPRRAVIVGAGYTGVEAAGEILRRYADADLRLTLVEGGPRLLPSMPAPIGEFLRHRGTSRGMDCITGDPVAKLTARTVFLQSGQRVPSHATIWAGGPRAPEVLGAAMPGASPSWVPVEDTLEHPHFANVFIAGDSAAPPNAVSKQAYHALDMGALAADNIRRRDRRRRLRSYRPLPRPTLLAFGDLDTVLVAGDRALASPALATGEELVCTAVLAQLDRRAPRERADALLDRGRQATRALLWPALGDMKSLLRQARVQRLS